MIYWDFFSTKKVSIRSAYEVDNLTEFKLFFNKLFFNNLNFSINSELVYEILKYFIIPIFGTIIILLVFSLIINRYKFEYLSKKKKEIDGALNDFITEIIFSDYTTEEIKSRISSFKETIPYDEKWCRYLILNKLIHFKQNIQGLDKNRILLIYKYFGLQKYSQKLLKNNKWYYKSLGIFHYQVLDYKIKKGSIKSFLNSKNKFLKSNALIATIALSDEKFGVLDNYTEKISRADELKILDIIYQKKSSVPKNIDKWLSNTNHSIVILALKIIIRYKDKLSLKQIESLLNHPEILVRKETLLAIRELKIVDANETLMEYYHKENHKRNKISCLKTLGVIGNDKTLLFAKSLLDKESDLEVKFEILNCICKIDRNELNHLNFTNNSETETIEKIILHVTNPHLN